MSPDLRPQFPPPFNFTPPITKFLGELISTFLGSYSKWDHVDEGAEYYMRGFASVVASLETHEGIVVNFPRWNIAMDRSNGPLLKYQDLPVQGLIRATERERMKATTSQSSRDSMASQQPALGSQHPPLGPPMSTTDVSMQRSSIPIDSTTSEAPGSTSQATVRPPAKVRFAQDTRFNSASPSTGAPSHDASPEFNDAEHDGANDNEDLGMIRSHSEDEYDVGSDYEEPSHNERPVPRKGSWAPQQQNDTGDNDDDGDEDVLATGLPMDDIPQAVLQETLAALKRFTLECNDIAKKHGVSPSVPRWVFLNAESLGLNKRCGNPFNAYQQTEMAKRGWHKSYAEGQRLTTGMLLLYKSLLMNNKLISHLFRSPPDPPKGLPGNEEGPDAARSCSRCEME